jgi:hypothetical protein
MVTSMTEKHNQQDNTSKEETTPSTNKDTANQPEHTVSNPFEDGKVELSQEEMDNIEQFKEAQTERD